MFAGWIAAGRVSFWSGWMVLAVMCLTGCGSDGPDLSDVSGKVTIDGQPVPGVVLTFVPETTGGSPSYGKTDASGQYRLMFTATKYGAMPGSHRVEMNITKMSKDELAEMRAAGEEVPEQNVQIPRQYRQSGALTATVNSGRTEIDFALTSK